MFMNRPLLLILALLLSLLPDLPADGGATAPHVYEGRITGLFCNACAAKVKASLGKLEGVTAVKITQTDELGVQKVHLESSSKDITKESAIRALGEDAKSFHLQSLERVR